MNTNKHDIHERIYSYVVDVLRFIRTYSKTFENQILAGQLIRSISSVGANDQEADGALTKPDFIHCYTIVRKEAKESLFWLRLLSDCNNSHKNETEKLLQEGDEIVRVVTAIIFNTKKS